MAPKRSFYPAPECSNCGGDHRVMDCPQAMAEAWAAGFRIGLSSAGTGDRTANRAPGPAPTATDSYRPSYGQASNQTAKRYKGEAEKRPLPEEGQMDRKKRDELNFLDQEIANMKRGMGRLEERRRKLLASARDERNVRPATSAVPIPPARPLVAPALPTAPAAPAHDSGIMRPERLPGIPGTRARLDAMKARIEAHILGNENTEDGEIDDQLP